MVVRAATSALHARRRGQPPLIRNPPFTNQVSIGSNAFDAGAARDLQSNHRPADRPEFDPANPPNGLLFLSRAEPEDCVGSPDALSFSISSRATTRLTWATSATARKPARHARPRRGRHGAGEKRLRHIPRTLVAYENRAAAQYDSLQTHLQKRLSNNVQGNLYTCHTPLTIHRRLQRHRRRPRLTRRPRKTRSTSRSTAGNSSFDIRHLLSATRSLICRSATGSASSIRAARLTDFRRPCS